MISGVVIIFLVAFPHDTKQRLAIQWEFICMPCSSFNSRAFNWNASSVYGCIAYIRNPSESHVCHMEIIVTNNNNGDQADNYKRYFEDALYNYRIKNLFFLLQCSVILMPSLYVNLPRGLGTNLTGLSIVALHRADHQQDQLTMFLHEVSGYSMNPIIYSKEAGSPAVHKYWRQGEKQEFENLWEEGSPGCGGSEEESFFVLLLTKLFFRICSLLNISAHHLPSLSKSAFN